LDLVQYLLGDIAVQPPELDHAVYVFEKAWKS
jgi:hypothetical protein